MATKNFHTPSVCLLLVVRPEATGLHLWLFIFVSFGYSNRIICENLWWTHLVFIDTHTDRHSTNFLFVNKKYSADFFN